MRGLTAAWLFGMGIITWRAIARQHQPPVPGTMLAASGFFALLALVSEYQAAAPAAAAIGWGVDLAALLNLFTDSPLFGNPGAKQPVTVSTGTTQAPGTTTAAGRGA